MSSPTSTRGSSTICSRSSRSEDSLRTSAGSTPRRTSSCAPRNGRASPIASSPTSLARDRDGSREPTGYGAASCATFKSVDTCAAEFEAYTPYYYSTYEMEDEAPPKQPGQKRIMILGGGPNRIGQGIEFDYCCCHASFALRELGIESIMVNSNPETVEHRLRHERHAVLRAAHGRGRAEHLRPWCSRTA